MPYIGAGTQRFNTADGLTVTGDAQIDTTTLVVDAANNRVGIGTASPSVDLEIASTAGSIKLTDTDGSDKETIIKHSGGTFFLQARDGSSNAPIVFGGNGGGSFDEHLRVLSGGGLTFNGDTATANALSDYEEGTWTPTWGVASGSITAHSNSSGRYTKIGRMVYIQGYISYQSNSGASGNVTVEGLPFTSVSSGFGQSDNQAGGVASFVNSLWTSDSPDGGRIPAGTTQILPTVNDNTGATQIQFNDFSTGGNHSQFVFFGHYYI
jgi:hypothetical protein